MKWINSILIALLLSSLGVFGIAASNIYFVNHLSVDPIDKPSLQRGARFYFNYCASCHGLRYETYQQVATLIGLDTTAHPEYATLIRQAFLFDLEGDISQPILPSMHEEDAKQWFGVIPPDLTEYTQMHSPAHLYNFLRAFYRDDHSITGSNNIIVPNTQMPNVLSPLRGETIPVFNANGFDHFVTVKPGQLKPLDFDRAIYDLVNFLDQVAKPHKILRVWIGIAVSAFLIILLLLIYFWRLTFTRNSML